MCDEEPNFTEVESNQSDFQLSLLDLPIEIFLHICSFLDAATLIHTLSPVCKQFHEVLKDDSMWKARISQIWPNANYPVLPPAEDDELFWKLSCVALEKQNTLWRKEDSMKMLPLSHLQYGTIDGLLLMQNGDICISGARDRSLVCWNISMMEDKIETYSCIVNAHTGWIWDLTAIDNKVYSCSWDKTVKAWTLTDSALVYSRTYEMVNAGPLLCIASCPDLALFATGSFCKAVLVFDLRLGHNPIAVYQPHKKAVIKLAMNSQFILSASEDGTVSIWDQRARKVMKDITISESFPTSVCMQRDMVYIGDSNAKLHVLDPKKNFEPVKCYTTGHIRCINGIHVTQGCLITSSMDNTVRISSPTDPPQHITTIDSTFGITASTDYLNDVLAISGTDGVAIWKPRYEY